MITTENGFELSDKIKYKYFNTSMDYLQKVISRFNFREGREQKRKVLPFMSIVKEPTTNVRQGYYYRQRDRIIETIRAAKNEKSKLFKGYESMSQDEKEAVWRIVGGIKQECIEEVEKMSTSPATMYLTLRDIDTPENKDVAKFVFEVLFGRPDQAFFTMILDSKEEIYTLEETEGGEYEFYGFTYKKVPLSAENRASLRNG